MTHIALEDTQELDTVVLKSQALSPLHRKIGRSILAIRSSFGEQCAQFRIAMNTDRSHVIVIRPSLAECTPIHIYLYVNPIPTAGTIGLGAGRIAYVNIPEDVYPPLAATTVDIVAGAITTIMQGGLVETICTAGSFVYKESFVLPTAFGKIAVDRFKLTRLVRGMFKRKSKQTIVHPPYCRAEHVRGSSQDVSK